MRLNALIQYGASLLPSALTGASHPRDLKHQPNHDIAVSSAPGLFSTSLASIAAPSFLTVSNFNGSSLVLPAPSTTLESTVSSSAAQLHKRSSASWSLTTVHNLADFAAAQASSKPVSPHWHAASPTPSSAAAASLISSVRASRRPSFHASSSRSPSARKSASRKPSSHASSSRSPSAHKSASRKPSSHTSNSRATSPGTSTAQASSSRSSMTRPASSRMSHAHSSTRAPRPKDKLASGIITTTCAHGSAATATVLHVVDAMQSSIRIERPTGTVYPYTTANCVATAMAFANAEMRVRVQPQKYNQRSAELVAKAACHCDADDQRCRVDKRKCHDDIAAIVGGVVGGVLGGLGTVGVGAVFYDMLKKGWRMDLARHLKLNDVTRPLWPDPKLPRGSGDRFGDLLDDDSSGTEPSDDSTSGDDNSSNSGDGDEPAKDEPAEDEPAEDEPAEDEPAEDEPAEDEPAEDEPAEDEPAEDEPAEDEPAEDEPAEDEPAEDEPAEDEPAEDEPAQGDEPTQNEPTKGDEPVQDEPAKGEEPVNGEPVKGDEPVHDKPFHGDEPGHDNPVHNVDDDPVIHKDDKLPDWAKPKHKDYDPNTRKGSSSTGSEPDSGSIDQPKPPHTGEGPGSGIDPPGPPHIDPPHIDPPHIDPPHIGGGSGGGIDFDPPDFPHPGHGGSDNHEPHHDDNQGDDGGDEDNESDEKQPDDKESEDNAPEDNEPGDEVPDDKVPEDKVPEDKVPEDNEPEDKQDYKGKGRISPSDNNDADAPSWDFGEASRWPEHDPKDWPEYKPEKPELHEESQSGQGPSNSQRPHKGPTDDQITKGRVNLRKGAWFRSYELRPAKNPWHPNSPLRIKQMDVDGPGLGYNTFYWNWQDYPADYNWEFVTNRNTEVWNRLDRLPWKTPEQRTLVNGLRDRNNLMHRQEQAYRAWERSNRDPFALPPGSNRRLPTNKRWELLDDHAHPGKLSRPPRLAKRRQRFMTPPLNGAAAGAAVDTQA